VLRDERKTLAPRSPRLRRPRPLDAGPFGADIASFELHLAAENKAAATIRIYTEAPRWFAAAHLLPETDKTRWDQVDVRDVQRWMVWLLRHYSETYAYQQYRSLQQFFRWLAAEDEIADPMAGLRAPKVADKPVPFFTSVELSKLEKACQGSTFRHHFSHTWLERGGAEGDLMELNGWSSPQMLQRYGASARGARARRHYDIVMDD